MRRMVRSVALSLALVPGLLVGPGMAVRAQSGVGTEVPFVDPEGLTHGTILVKEVGDPYKGADPARPAPEGERYVGLSVAFTAADDQTFDANPSWVILRDTNGGLHSPTYLPRLPDDKVPDLQAQVMAPGNRISGFIGYSVPKDAVVDDVLYVDSSTHALPLADLVPAAGPAAGSPVDYVADDGTQGQFTIQVADPFEGFDPRYPAPEGSRYVGLSVVASNPGDAPFVVTPTHFYLRDAAGNLYYPANVYLTEDSKLPALEGQPLAKGDRISGFVGYTVPAAAKVVAADLWPSGSRRVTLADLAGGGPAPSAGPAASPKPASSVAPASVAPAPSVVPAASAGTSQ